MAFRKGSTSTRVALATGLASVLSVVAYAQLGGAPPPPPYTPAEGAKDLKSVLFNWPWHMGMLRGIEEHELAVTLEYRGEGTIQVNGQPCAIKPVRGSAGRRARHVGIPHQQRVPICRQPHADQLHAAEWSDLFQHRGRQRHVRLG